MYIDACRDRSGKKEIIRIVERVKGERVFKELEPVYEYYIEDEYGSYPTLTGGYAEKRTFNSYFEMKRSLDNVGNKKTYESGFNVLFKTLAKEYMGQDAPELNILFFDIETDFDKTYGYAPPGNPFNRVTAISLYQSWTGKDYVLVLPPPSITTYEAEEIVRSINEKSPDSSTVILYLDEKEMFIKFFELMYDADVLTGWNSEFFDIPYMINRTSMIFNESMTRNFCLWDKKPIPREADLYGKKVITYELVGRISLDQLALYKKHQSQVQQSYKLDDIASQEIGEHKVAYEGTLDVLYNNDFETFIDYSLTDSKILYGLHKKFDFINLHNRLAHNECVLISTTMGSVALIDTSIINLAHKRGEVVFDKKKVDESYDDYDDDDDDDDYDADFDFETMMEEMEEKSTKKAAGAWVQDPFKGLVPWIGCTDFNSLYPTVLRVLGMSTECIIGQIRQDYTDAYLDARIDEQRRSYKGRKFKPNWTDAWHGLFAAVEFTMVYDKSPEIITVDLEDGTTFEISAAEFHDIVYADDSEIVISANGTLFDRKKAGVIPEILTTWYSERKQQQKMLTDYKHLALDGWEMNSDILSELIIALDNYEGKTGNQIYRTNIHTSDAIFHIRNNLTNVPVLAKLIKENGLILKDGKLFCQEHDKDHCNERSAFWKQNQQIRKILLNSLYGALLNAASVFYDPRLGQSVTLTGRSMTKHMASVINEIVTGSYSHTGGAVVYGDTDSVYFSVAKYAKEVGEPFDLSKEDVVELYNDIGNEMGKQFPEFMDKMFNTGIEKGKIVGADLEMVGSMGLFLKKKRYAILKYWEDGFRKDVNGKPGEIKAMGLEIKRSDTPKYIQDFLEDTLTSLLVGETEQEIRTKVKEFKTSFHSKPSIDKGSPKTVKNLSKKYTEYQNTGKCSVGHVKAAIEWNRLREINDDKTVPEATDGTKIIVCKLKSNPLNISNIGFPIECKTYLPDWFLELPFDDVEMEKAVLTKKLDNIFGILDIDIGIHERSDMVDDFFTWE